jgi:hypothetical protein
MAFTSYDNVGVSNTGPLGQIVLFYEEVELITYAFTTSATYTDPFAAGSRTCFFTTSAGSFSAGTTYYAAGGKELTPASTSSQLGVYINGVNDNGITGIGTYTSGSGSLCYYEIAGGADSYTPFLYGTVFTPTSETASSNIGLLTFAAAAGDTPPAKATNPSPANSATGVSINQATLTWTQGTGATSEDVYFGPSGNMSLVESDDTGQSYALAVYLPLGYNTAYQWRIDSKNAIGTTTGDTWSFTTLALNPPSFSGPGTAAFQIIKRLCACAADTFWYEDI